MAYIDQYAAARVTNFLQRLEMALVQNARDIIAEDKSTPNHYNRSILATLVMHDATGWASRFKDAVAVNNVADGTSTDADFYSAVVFFWNAFAGTTFNGALTI